MFIIGMFIRLVILYFAVKFIVFLFEAMADHGY